MVNKFILLSITKICGHCKIKKPVEEFGTCISRKDKLQPWCRRCRRDYNKNYYLSHKK
jgi:hypothetical protein